MVPRVIVVPLRRQNLFKHVPVTRVKHSVFRVFHFAVSSPERCSRVVFWRPPGVQPAVRRLRAVAPEYFAEHCVRRFGKRIKDNAQGFCADHFSVGAVITDGKMPSAVLTFAALFAAGEAAPVKNSPNDSACNPLT
jgi:hypothetical protein